MSEENLELARRAMKDADSFFRTLDEHVVADFRSFPLPDLAGVTHGRDAHVEWARRYWGTWTDYDLAPVEFVDAGESVVIVIHERGTGRLSGVTLDRVWAQLWTFRNGRIVRVEPFRTRAEALEAAGLSE